jgi:hypothetical protein
MSCCVYTITGPHETLSLTATSVASNPAPRAGTLRIVSRRNAHIAIGAAATTSDHFVLPDIPIFISIGEGQTLNARTAASEPDGDMHISYVDRS